MVNLWNKNWNRKIIENNKWMPKYEAARKKFFYIGVNGWYKADGDGWKSFIYHLKRFTPFKVRAEAWETSPFEIVCELFFLFVVSLPLYYCHQIISFFQLTVKISNATNTLQLKQRMRFFFNSMCRHDENSSPLDWHSSNRSDTIDSVLTSATHHSFRFSLWFHFNSHIFVQYHLSF